MISFYSLIIFNDDCMISGAAVGIQGWDIRLRAAFDRANTTGLFKDTYFMENPQEYFVSERF